MEKLKTTKLNEQGTSYYLFVLVVLPDRTGLKCSNALYWKIRK